MHSRCTASRGYALIAALILVVVVSLAVEVAVSSSRLAAQREREAQLLFAGDQIRKAILSYYAHVPKGAQPVYPLHLEDLLEDQRFPMVVRHLRRPYPDPMTGKTDWVLETLQGRIVGVHSGATGSPLRNANFSAADAGFSGAKSYKQWRFAAASADAIAGLPLMPVPAVTTVDTSMAPAETPATPAPPDPSQARSNYCYGAYMLPKDNCSDEPRPYGANEGQCIAYFDQMSQSCLNSSSTGP